jgi:hypothetical protein
MYSSLLRKLVGIAVVVASIAGFAGSAAGQGSKVSPGSLDLAGVMGIGETGDAGFSGGVRLEHGWRTMGSGNLGLQLSGDFYWWSYGLGYKWYVLPLGINANYHFPVASERFDPFIGVGVGYTIANCSWGPGVWGRCEGAESEIYPIARLGTRLFVSDVTAIYVDAGLGASTVSAGLSFRLKGGSN